jgi:hypothetical protein
MRMGARSPTSDLALRIEEALNREPDRPWCVHRLCEHLMPPFPEDQRDSLIDVTQRAADEVVASGAARREYVSAVGIGVHCEDSMYWTARSKVTRLEEFGPAYESPVILNRLASHLRCHGL